MASPYVDLNGLLQLQSQYLTGLKANPEDTALTGKVSELQSQLQNLYTGYGSAIGSGNAVLDHQTAMAGIVDTENARLMAKKQNIDNALVGRKRATMLNESYRQRYARYTDMLVTTVITLVVFLGIVVLGRYFTFIPSFVFDLLSIVVVIVGVFTCYFIYLDIARRDKMNFDELNVDGPLIVDPETIKKNAAAEGKKGNLLGSINIGGCVGASCCSAEPGKETEWDPDYAVCAPKGTLAARAIADAETAKANAAAAANTGTTSAFTLMNKPVRPNAGYEYDSYAPILR